MLRPATPLTILLFAAFALLLISVLSTPIIKQIPLGSFGGVDFGVFGYCKGTDCTPIEIGYNTQNLFSEEQTKSFDLSNDTRATLSAILIVHPIAAFLTLVMLCLAAAAHFHSPSHSPRYLLGVFILSILTLIASLLSFLIDVLLFVPHMAWGSYVVLAATILIAASGIVSCAMRRTLVSRKARKRRIAENAEMNGENFYNRQGPEPATLAPSSTTMVEPGVDKLPAFATFEMAKKEPERTSDERIPLTQTPSDNSPSNGTGPIGVGISDRYGGPPTMGQNPQRDQYGNMIPGPVLGAYGSRSRDPSTDPSMNRQYSENSMNSRGRGGYRGGPRGGGYASNLRGGQPRGYGPPRGGGYGGSHRDPMMGGAPGPGGMVAGAMMRGGRGGAPPAYGRGGYDNRGMSPAGYGQRRSQSQGPYAQPPSQTNTGEYAAYNPDDSRSSLPRAESPPPLPGLDSPGPVGQAIEMDATTGSPSTTPSGFGQFGNLRESDGDVAGMVGLQQQKLQRQGTVASESSRYSTEDAYVPPRQAWDRQGEQGRSSPLNPNATGPAELPSEHPTAHRRISSAGDNYYEDVDPRFATESQALSPSVPAPLALGFPQRSQPPQGQGQNQNLRPLQPISKLDGSNSYEDLHSGARSPAESDRSNFTSVSQRGVNPRWNGGPGYAPMPGPMPSRRQVPQQNDILLNSNPDFELPGGRGNRAGRGSRGGFPTGGSRQSPGPGMVPNSAYPI